METPLSVVALAILIVLQATCSTSIPVSPINGEVINDASSPAAAVCGVPAIEPIPPAERIVGGIEAKPNSWPWMCILESKQGHTWTQQCGCSVLNSMTLVTAAHCIAHGSRWTYRVRCGIHYNVGNNSHEQTVVVANYTHHELFTHPTLDYDVGILKLATPLTLNDFVSPVCLPQKDVEPGTICIATGWGTTSEVSDPSNELRQVAIPVLPQKQCIKDYQAPQFPAVTDRMLCAGYPDGGKDHCYGDSGGPLVNKRDGVWEIQGIISWANGCAEKGYPGVYARVTQLKDWIKQRL